MSTTTMIKIDPNLAFLIHGKKTGTNELLMIPVYNPNIGEYISNKLISENYYDQLIIETPNHNKIFERNGTTKES